VISLVILGAMVAATVPCPGPDRGTLEEWKCYGELEYASRTEGEDDFGARFVVFANGERLYEKREPAATKFRLMGEGWSLYRGLDREDSTVVGRHDARDDVGRTAGLVGNHDPHGPARVGVLGAGGNEWQGEHRGQRSGGEFRNSQHELLLRCHHSARIKDNQIGGATNDV